MSPEDAPKLICLWPLLFPIFIIYHLQEIKLLCGKNDIDPSENKVLGGLIMILRAAETKLNEVFHR